LLLLRLWWPNRLCLRLSLRPWLSLLPRLSLRRSHGLRLRSRAPFNLSTIWLRAHLWLRWRNHSRLGRRSLVLRRFSPLLWHLRPHGLLLLRVPRRALLLLRRDHLLPRSFSLRLLLLTKRSALSLLLLHRLRYALSLSESRNPRPSGCLRRQWLLPQLLQLLTRVSIATRGLSREIRHLALTRLLGRDIRLLGSLL